MTLRNYLESLEEGTVISKVKDFDQKFSLYAISITKEEAFLNENLIEAMESEVISVELSKKGRPIVNLAPIEY